VRAAQLSLLHIISRLKSERNKLKYKTDEQRNPIIGLESIRQAETDCGETGGGNVVLSSE